MERPAAPSLPSDAGARVMRRRVAVVRRDTPLTKVCSCWGCWRCRGEMREKKIEVRSDLDSLVFIRGLTGIFLVFLVITITVTLIT